MERRALQNLARRRLQEARFLLGADIADTAYHLSGCAVECALKACIARSFLRHTWPDRRFVQEVHSHNLDRLVALANLRPQMESEFGKDWHFRERWDIVRVWNNESRYRQWQRSEAVSIYEAVADTRHGVLRWIRRYW